MAFWNKVEKARAMFLEHRTGVDNAAFLEQFACFADLAPVVIVLRAALADRCCVAPHMLHAGDECAHLERIMGRGRWAFIGDLGYGQWDYLEFCDSLERVLQDERLYWQIVERHIALRRFGKEEYSSLMHMRSRPTTLSQWLQEAALPVQKRVQEAGDESAGNLQRVAAAILGK